MFGFEEIAENGLGMPKRLGSGHLQDLQAAFGI